MEQNGKQEIIQAIQSVSVSFTLVMAVYSVFTLTNGDGEWAEAAFPLQLIAFLAVCCLWERGAARFLPLRPAGWLAVCVVGEYAAFLGASRLFHWFGFRMANVLAFSLLFGMLQLAARLFFYGRERTEAARLNRALCAREKEGRISR